MSTATFQAYASPTDAKLPNGEPVGDHTYVVANGNVWPCLGGDSGGRKLESGTGTIAAATCMGDPKRTTFMGIPSSAGIVYAVNGVCHQIANRVLYTTNATVTGADGYIYTQILYGTYGTFVPVYIFWYVPLLMAAALAIEGGVLVDWVSRTGKCENLQSPATDTSRPSIK